MQQRGSQKTARPPITQLGSAERLNVRKWLRWGLSPGDARAVMKKTLRVALVLAAGLAVTLSPPADAASDTPRITALVVASHRIADGGCHDFPVKIRFDAAGWRVEGINVKVFHGDELVGLLAARPADPDATSANTTVKWCESSPLGRYVLGPSTIYYRDPGGQGGRTVEDSTTAPFHVRRAARTAVLSQTASSVTTRLRAYSPSADKFTPVSQIRMKLQRRAGGHWVIVAKAVTDAAGRATLEGAGGRVVSVRTSTVAKSKIRL